MGQVRALLVHELSGPAAFSISSTGATLGIALLGTVFLHGHSMARAFWLAAVLVVATAGTASFMRER